MNTAWHKLVKCDSSNIYRMASSCANSFINRSICAGSIFSMFLACALRPQVLRQLEQRKKTHPDSVLYGVSTWWSVTFWHGS